MSKLLVIGATGSLGRHVVQQAIAANHEVAVIVRTPAKLAAEVRDKVTVHQADLSRISALDFTERIVAGGAAERSCRHRSADERFFALSAETCARQWMASCRP